MDKTVFEKIIARELPAEIVYEDEETLAFLDSAPNTFGHTLVIPKHPFVNIFDISETALSAVMKTVRTVAPAVRDAVGAAGVHINSNHGHDAGQEVAHLHFHIIPRHTRSEFTFWPHTTYPDDQAKEVAQKIRMQLGN